MAGRCSIRKQGDQGPSSNVSWFVFLLVNPEAVQPKFPEPPARSHRSQNKCARFTPCSTWHAATPCSQAEFNALRDQLAAQYPDRAALIFQYDEPLSHLIYAGSDMF